MGSPYEAEHSLIIEGSLGNIEALKTQAEVISLHKPLQIHCLLFLYDFLLQPYVSLDARPEILNPTP